jgi:uncharacterized NAD(P)/FAD-binding protein YdhS
MVKTCVRSEADAPLDIGIVGLGPRGLSLLERILALAPLAPGRRFNVVIFEPNEPGTGVHWRGQPDYLMLNTIACQLSMFPDCAALGATEERPGPSFFDWCVMQNIRVDEDGVPCPEGGRPVAETDFLPRRLLGEYLQWTFRYLMREVPQNVTVRIHRERAVEVLSRTDPVSFTLRGETGTEETVAKLFVSVGHSGRRESSAAASGGAAAKEVYAPYPLPRAVDAVAPGETVGLAGFGLAAMDVIAALTVGRGGRQIRRAGGGQRYELSGREPKIVIFSRTGLPFYTRPNTTVDRRKHQPVFLTPETIARLRRQTADGRLDFEGEILPLIKHEMRAAYYIVSADMFGADTSMPATAWIRERMAAAYEAGNLDETLADLDIRYGAFSPDEYLLVAPPEELSGDAYVEWVRHFIQFDLLESTKGLTRSPIKAALEVWRDLRDTLRDIVNHRGLDERSHEVFHTTYSQLVCRLVAGPQKERHEDLLALVDAGVVEFFPGVNPSVNHDRERIVLAAGGIDGAASRTVDRIIKARLDSAGLIGTDSPVLASLHRAALVRPRCMVAGLDGIDIDANGHPLGPPEAIAKAIWVFGPNVEGGTYYNHYVPSSGAYSRAFADAHRAVAECLNVCDEAAALRSDSPATPFSVRASGERRPLQMQCCTAETSLPV